MPPIGYTPTPNFLIVCNPKLRLDYHVQIAIIKRIFQCFYYQPETPSIQRQEPTN